MKRTFARLDRMFWSSSRLVLVLGAAGSGRRSSFEAIERSNKQRSEAYERIKCPEDTSLVDEQSFKRQINISSYWNR